MGSPYCCFRGQQISRLPYGAPMSGDVMVVQMRYIVQHESGLDYNHNTTFRNLAKCRILSAVLVLGAFVWMWWSCTICTEADLIGGWSYDERVNDHNMPLLGSQCRTGNWVQYLMVLALGTCATEDSVRPVLYPSLTCWTHCTVLIVCRMRNMEVMVISTQVDESVQCCSVNVCSVQISNLFILAWFPWLQVLCSRVRGGLVKSFHMSMM